MAKNNEKIFSVSQVNTLVKVALEEFLPPRLIVRGEISDFKHHNSGHCYFSLKDEGSILPCVMWASKFNKVKFEPENGLAVLATGHVDVYLPGGKYQLYVDKLEPEGVGALQLAFEKIYRKLEAQGLFEDEHKKPLPQYPQKIGILTSPTGAAVGDIETSIRHRWPCVELLLFPVPVQGDGAAESIAARIREVNRNNKKHKLDLLIVGRGGGSREDLWAFNEEPLAHAIFESQIPVISAVGHEYDTTIADLVADARASTPTKAGVIAVPDITEVTAQLDYLQRSLVSKLRWKLELAQKNIDTLTASAVFRNPKYLLFTAAQQLDERTADLTETIKGIVAESKDSLQQMYEKIAAIEPHRLAADKKNQLSDLQSRFRTAVTDSLNTSRLRLAALENRLAALDPRSVLNRGYSMTTVKKTGKIVRNVDDISKGDIIITELADKNFIESEVKTKENRQPKVG